MKKHTTLILLVALFLAMPNAAFAWHDAGHMAATTFALAALPEDVPEFFREGGELAAGSVTDPDMFTRPVAPWELHSVESQEHFFDVEFLTAGEEKWILPATRFEFLEQCYDRKTKPYRVGLAPYAVMEWTQRLTVAFAEHRRRPDDQAVRQKCLVYAGILAHYAGDVCQPLHTSIHYDGKVAKIGDPSPRSGIHNKVDGLIGKLNAKPDDVLKGLKIGPLYDRTALAPKTPTTAPATAPATVPTTAPATATRPGPSPLLQAILAEIHASHGLVDQVYALESDLPDMDKPLPADSLKVRDFALDRLRGSTRFVASLYLTAWRDSEFIEIPAWHRGKHE